MSYSMYKYSAFTYAEIQLHIYEKLMHDKCLSYLIYMLITHFAIETRIVHVW